MLVIISDLHFTDGTTSNYEIDGKGKKIDLFNVKANAFKMFFSRIADIVQKTNAKTPGSIKEVKFIYNGDIFDPLRSTEWFKPEVIQPWKAPANDGSVIATATRILEAIIKKNEMPFKWLSGGHSEWSTVWTNVAGNVTVERIYIPGNHDRILNLDAGTRTQIQNALGLVDSKKFEHCFDDKYYPNNPTTYRTLVMHGHEADPQNIESSNGAFDYDAMPIGDPMTTMLFAKIGHDIANLNLRIAQTKADEAKSRFREIDNVRPASSVGEFIKDVVEDFKLHNVVDKALDGIVSEFNGLAFYQKWIKEHDTWHPLDPADKVQILLASLEFLSPSRLSMVMSKISKIKEELDSDPCPEHAKNLLKKNSKYLFCVMGHTHDPAHVPLFIGSDKKERHYLNSGTFREVFTQSLDGEHFIRHQRMSYVVIYGPNEFDGDNADPVYEMWNGLRARN